jgi:uncharacterized protein (TIGR02246 family)
MKFHRTLLTAFALLACSATGFTQEKAPSEAEKAAKARDDAYIAAFEKGDAKALAAFYTEDTHYSTDDGTQINGRAAVQEGLVKYFAKNKGAKLQVEMESARLLTPDVLLEKGLSTVVPKEGEPETTRYSVTYVKKDGAWLIADLDEIELPAVDEAAQALGDLDWLVGTWKDQTPGITVETKTNWTLGQHFLRRSFSVTREGEDPVQGTEVIGYDAAHGQLRSWIFDSAGGFGEGVWRQEGNKWLVQMTSTAIDGSQTTAQNVITRLAENKLTWESINRVREGEVLPNIDKVEVVRTATTAAGQ